MKQLNPDVAAKLNPQESLVYEYLQKGKTLTNMIAIVSLGVGSLTARIAALRKMGLEVMDEWAEDHFEKRYKRYWVERDAATDS